MTLITFLAIDSFWLGFIAPSFYRSQIGHLMAEDANFLAAGIFYLLYIYGLLFFVVEPAVKSNNSNYLIRGALFGLITYATYDLTNLATLRDWSLLVTVVDMAWGTILCGLITWVSVWASKKLKL
ncbi:MAG TPA: DUF2177 domain-containing protein [Anaerolineae bacterium]|nr:DUF2177 domain-containing protein [Anaerolineae bacterium]